jgi:hypothetical protein
MSGSRSNIVQHLRTVTPNAAPASGVLLDGELAVEQADPMKLWVGVPTALDATGRKLLFDKGQIAQAQVRHDASLLGTGQTASPLAVAQATQAQLAGARVATTLEIAALAAPLDTVMLTPAGLRTQNGLDASQLVTTAKQVVPAINEIMNGLAQALGVLVFAGAYDALASTGTYNGHGGVAAGTGPLPVAAAGNSGAFLIVYTDGPGSVGNEPPGTPLHAGDWMVSDGAAWMAIHMHQATITADNIAVVPPVAGGTTVQAALEAIWAVASTALQAIYFTTPTFSGDALAAATALEVNILDSGVY